MFVLPIFFWYRICSSSFVYILLWCLSQNLQFPFLLFCIMHVGKKWTNYRGNLNAVINLLKLYSNNFVTIIKIKPIYWLHWSIMFWVNEHRIDKFPLELISRHQMISVWVYIIIYKLLYILNVTVKLFAFTSEWIRQSYIASLY